MKTKIFALIFIALFLTAGIASAQNIYTQNYSTSGITDNANFVVKVLKYEPYPVSPGEYFDLWIKVENIGQKDARNARFVLGLEYPFSSDEELTRNYGVIYGTANANQNKLPGETEIEANQVILKYRVKVDENADPGNKFVKLTAYNENGAAGNSYNLPITIDKTKTNFLVALQKSGPEGYSFIISNIGQSNASSLSITLEPKEGITFEGDKMFVIGGLNPGDFTKFNAPMSANNVNEVAMKIDYTDSSGSRRSIEKNVSIEGAFQNSSGQAMPQSKYTVWIYAFIGFIVGLIAMSLVKRRQIKNLSK